MDSIRNEQEWLLMSRAKVFKRHCMAALPIFALLVILVVFWWLKLTGITMAGEAFCGKEEHVHDETCAVTCTEEHEHTTDCGETLYICGMDEHTHVSSCYSNIQADLETVEDWEATLADIPAGLSVPERVVAVAKSQLGYTESERNFVVNTNDIRYGYTRYGEWYGNPYGDWKNMFTAFCLRYAGLSEVPVNAGADAMHLAWTQQKLYRPAASYQPLPGDVVFLDKDEDGVVDATAIILTVTDDALTVIEGDLENQVAQIAYLRSSATVHGYGLTAPGGNLLMMAAPLADTRTYIAKTINYSSGMFTDTSSFVVYTESAGNYYAFDGNGNSVPIYIDASGNITADITDPNLLLWSFTYSSTNTYTIQNLSTGRYMHAYPNNGTGVTTSGAYSSTLLTQSDGTVKIRSNNEYARLVVADGNFQMTQNQSLASAYRFGVVSRCTVWLDGTCGGLMSLSGAADRSYTVGSGGTIKLPTEWQSPAKYNYVLRSWYDVKNRKFYPPGAEVVVNDTMVFYADWVAATYDIGTFNAQAANSLDTNAFITTRLFDYSVLFNLLSESVSVNATASSHTETWSLLTSGNNPFNGQPTLNFIMRDWDRGSEDISYPKNTNNPNNPTSSGQVYSGLYTETLRELLFNPASHFDPTTGTGVPGVGYLGTGNYLFQYMSDPSDPHYGYYYYDSALNAASYNQSEGRFYVYDYLERTSDSAGASNGTYSDFLPLNSPYANTNNKDVVTYTYNGVKDEYQGVSHLQYDAKYSGSGSSADHVATNFWFGMSMDLRFFLPDVPGAKGEDGQTGNRDLYGKEMHFQFSGDDDVWVLVDGKLVLDLGGVHGIESGDINFSTGVVTVNGKQTATLSGISEGEHTLTVLYLERGSSQSNCAIYFNLAPRYSLSIQKEDVLTQQLLDGAQFSVYTDAACTKPAELWVSEQAYIDGAESTHVFTVTNGTATMWGLGAGKTYYIHETAPLMQRDTGCPTASSV